MVNLKRVSLLCHLEVMCNYHFGTTKRVKMTIVNNRELLGGLNIVYVTKEKNLLEKSCLV